MERDTRQRRAIRKVIEHGDRPMSTQEVLDAAQDAVPSLGMATVYRTIKSLVAEGLVKPVDLPGEAPRYEPAGKHHHHHFHCRACNKVFEIEGCPKDIQHLTPRGFQLEAHELTLYGACSACAKREL